MARTARVVVPGLPHRVTQRGNNRQDVFFTDDDRNLYLEFLAERSALHRVRIVGWCLMTNPFHLVVIPTDSDGLENAVDRRRWKYAQAINRLHGRSGHLWQDRFSTAPLDEAQGRTSASVHAARQAAEADAIFRRENGGIRGIHVHREGRKGASPMPANAGCLSLSARGAAPTSGIVGWADRQPETPRGRRPQKG